MMTMRLNWNSLEPPDRKMVSLPSGMVLRSSLSSSQLTIGAAFVEIVTDAQYEIRSKESYVGGWGQNQGYWGGTIVDARVVAGKSLVQLRSGQIAPGKYWVRTALFVGNTYGEDSPFNVMMYDLVGAPIDYKGGYYFSVEGGKKSATRQVGTIHSIC